MGKISKMAFVLAFWLSSAGLLSGWAQTGIPEANSSEKVPETHVRPSVQSNDLFDRIAEMTATVKDLSAQVDFQIHLFNLGMTFNVGGDLYYKQPDKMRLKLKEIPGFIFSRQNNALRTTNLLAGLRRDVRELYNSRIINQAALQGENCYVVQLIPKKEEGISRILLWVDSQNFTMPQVILHYEDGSHLTQRKTYTKADDVFVVKKMESDYDAPGMRAEILATFRNYKINKGVSDSLFERAAENNLVSIF